MATATKRTIVVVKKRGWQTSDIALPCFGALLILICILMIVGISVAFDAFDVCDGRLWVFATEDESVCHVIDGRTLSAIANKDCPNACDSKYYALATSQGFTVDPINITETMMRAKTVAIQSL